MCRSFSLGNYRFFHIFFYLYPGLTPLNAKPIQCSARRQVSLTASHRPRLMQEHLGGFLNWRDVWVGSSLGVWGREVSIIIIITTIITIITIITITTITIITITTITTITITIIIVWAQKIYVSSSSTTPPIKGRTTIHPSAQEYTPDQELRCQHRGRQFQCLAGCHGEAMECPWLAMSAW